MLYTCNFLLDGGYLELFAGLWIWKLASLKYVIYIYILIISNASAGTNNFPSESNHAQKHQVQNTYTLRNQ